MAYDLIQSLVLHMRADSTLVTLLGVNTRITGEPDEDTYPQLYVTPSGGGAETAGTATARVSLWVEAATRIECENAQNRVRQLFHEKSGYTIGTGAVTVYCVRSIRATRQTTEKASGAGAWESQAFYEFHIVEPHGF